MFRRFSVAALTVAFALPVGAQTPDGLNVRVDQSQNASDPDDVPDVTITQVDDGIQISTGPAAIVWDEANTASGEYTLSGRFTLQEPSSHNNYYGLFYGGDALEGESQNYLYFLIGQNGSYIVKHRANNEVVHDVQGRTPHDAIATPDADGTSVNELAVQVGAENTDFLVNGTVVFSAPRSGMAGRTDGVYGVRINHVIPSLLVEDLGVTN